MHILGFVTRNSGRRCLTFCPFSSLMFLWGVLLYIEACTHFVLKFVLVLKILHRKEGPACIESLLWAKVVIFSFLGNKN